jgi:hypothetical protein
VDDAGATIVVESERPGDHSGVVELASQSEIWK